MGIRDIVLPQETVAVGEDSFLVRGLSFADIGHIAASNPGVISTLFTRFMSGSTLDPTQVEKMDFSGIGESLLREAPQVVVEIITRSTVRGVPDPEDYEAVRNLPFPIQMDALDKIGRLTFASEEALGKLTEMAIRSFEGVTAAVLRLQSPLISGNGESGGK